MARVSDLIRDSKLETSFHPDCSVETVHTYQESDLTSRRRVVARSEHWKRLSKIGGGAYGSVWLEKCIRDSHQRSVQALRAVKQIDLDTRYGPIDYNRELEAIAKFSHSRYVRCFVRSFGWYEAPDQLFIAMEYLELGDLYQYLYDKPPLSEVEAKEIAFQILEGLGMMHENDFAHRDLKPGNILIKARPPDEWWIKIADFGISKRIEDGHGQASTLRGTPGYVAPELYRFIERGSPYATDIWATGEILFEILVKKRAFAHLGLLSSYAREEKFPSEQLVNAGVSQQGVDFVSLLMKAQPEDRLTAKAALSHEWLEKAPALASESPDSGGYSVPETPDSTPVPDSKSTSVETMTEEFASWDTEELSQQIILPPKADNAATTVLLNYNQTAARSSNTLNTHKADDTMASLDYSQSNSKSSTALNKPQNISRKPVATDQQPVRSSLSSSPPPGVTIFDSERKVRASPETPSKQSLASWWKRFRQTAEIKEEAPRGVFRVPLNDSIRYAHVPLSVTTEEGESIITGYVPIIIAMCGMFLKTNATETKNIFKVNGSGSKITELQSLFDCPPSYGRGIKWSDYSVHDVANLLTRYLRTLPEPVIPVVFYESFHEPLRMLSLARDIQERGGESPVHKLIIEAYRKLIDVLPPDNKQLLLYMLDFLAVFASKAEKNGMPADHLVGVFHHAFLRPLTPFEGFESTTENVLTFLIENQDHFAVNLRRVTSYKQP
ncbi:uncharacterized protein N7496_007278 [Penicillium cataractarum]|uniref:Protein kinase domain-containing protein n=1 Tax=Penicillium cataractarum TaxID=2100454 RepID=A0A9W9V9G0_9EURO|nr:uncharacterized protein N7496_007278 [Penicillium cataractarum]KAJ5371186.1 hypothetical protein N7496_007278 [Penicillium cataractarum]